MIDFLLLRSQIIEAAVTAVNAVAGNTAELARDKAPVRKVFAGGRQTVRFKTANEINADRALRGKLGLAPEILATPEAIAAVKASGRNPARGALIGGKEFGFARTVEHAGRRRTDIIAVRPEGGGEITSVIRRERQDRPRNLANRANKAIEPRRLGKTGELFDRDNEDRLTSRGRYELRTERAAFQALRPISADINPRTGEINQIHYGREGIARLGGALRDSIRVIRASAGQFPVIKASVVAGGEGVDYAKFQELGTRHNPAHPFLRPALAVAKDELPASLLRSLRRLGR